MNQNFEGERDNDLIRFTGAAHGLSHEGKLGTVMNACKFGEYLDNNGNNVIRESACQNLHLGKDDEKVS